MTADRFVTAAALSYGCALVGYALFAGRVAMSSHKVPRAQLLLVALTVTAAWAGTSLVLALHPTVAGVLAARVAEATRNGAWLLFLGNLVANQQPGEAKRTRGTRNLYVAVGSVLVISAFAGEGFAVEQLPVILSPRVGFVLHLAIAVAGLILVEQLVRRVHPQMRWGIKPLAVAMGSVFGLDLFFYADATLIGRLDPDIWLSRGFANALVIPLLVVATVRNSGWTIDLHLSRRALFQSTALLLSGAFLLMVAGAGYVVRYFGGEWGHALQIELLFAAGVLTVLILSSGQFRAKLRVFLSKHFFSYRYDYREEWLRFTRTLSTESTVNTLQSRTIVAIADLVESPAGSLWWKDGERGFVPAGQWNTPPSDRVEPVDGALTAFLQKTGWVIDVPEYVRDRALYRELLLPEWLISLNSPWLIVPLIVGAELSGFIVLQTPRTKITLDWEVRDLLKTASRQAASYLGHVWATEALLEARKFDAFNRMSAFVVHDLKNLIAQLSLLLKNAGRHGNNQEFQADMLATIEHVVRRMNALMLQLRAGTAPAGKPRPVSLQPLLNRVCAAKSDLRVPVVLDCVDPVSALGHEDRLEHVVGHVVQNAIDASLPQGGRVKVRLEANEGYALVVVQDEGCGMTPEFLRDRLFKPFETTKPSGMGIGVYESAQYLATIGGEIGIESISGHGTSVRLRLPRSGAPGSTGNATEVMSGFDSDPSLPGKARSGGVKEQAV